MAESEMLITITYGLIGATGALAVAIFAWGFVEYITKIGLPSMQRDGGIAIMQWGVRLIITAICIIFALRYLERWLG